MSDNPFNTLSTDLTELILSHLPIPSLTRATAVCKPWNTLITSPNFPSHPRHHLPWFFLHGVHNTNPKNNESFAFDPSSAAWLRLPSALPFPSADLLGSNGFLFSTAPSFSFSPVLKPRWTPASPLWFSRINPLLAVFHAPPHTLHAPPKFVVVGGVRFIGGLVDIEDRLAVEIYNPELNSWSICPPLPADFRSGNNSSQTLSSALFKNKFYVFGIYNFFVSYFDLDNLVWGKVLTLRPPGLIFAFLISCEHMLVLAGVCSGPHGGPGFNLWRVEVVEGERMEYSEIGIMPQDLLYGLVDIEEDDNKFASLKCVGMGNLLYVFNEEYHKKYPACVCEIDGGNGKCRWWKVPPLPSPVNKFHKVISFCSVVLPRDLFVGNG